MMTSTQFPGSRPADVIRPKNGRFIVALLAGGPADRFAELRNEWSREYRIWIQHHWPYKRPKEWGSNIPRDVDIVCGATAWMSHPLEERLKAACQRSSVQYFRVDKGQGHVLERYGFRKAATPLDWKTIYARPSEMSSNAVEDAFEDVAEVNAFLAELGQLEEVDGTTMETPPAEASPPESASPPVETVTASSASPSPVVDGADSSLVATLEGIIQLAGWKLENLIVRRTETGGRIELDWSRPGEAK